MDPSYSHAYPSSHRRSTSKISLPRRRSFIFTKEAIKSEPFLLLVASNVIAAYSTIAVDAWSLKRGVSPVVLIAGGLSVGAIWGAVRGRGRFDLVGDLWPTLLLYAGLHSAQYLAFFVALTGLSPLRVSLFTASLALWKTAVTSPRSSIPGTLSLVLATSISIFTSSASSGSLTSSIFYHLAIFTFLLLGNLKDSPERKLVTQFAGTGNGLDTARTLAMAIGAFALSFVVLFGLVIGRFDSSFHAFANVEGLHHFSYATLLAQAIIAHPTVLLVPSTVKPTSAKLAYPTTISIAMIVGMAFWRLEVESWDVAIAGIIWFSIVSLPVSPPNSNLLYPSHSSSSSSIATAPTPSSSTHRLLRTYLKTILANPESKKIWYFLLLNLAYMLVQMIWGVWTNSLGLISDAIHMFFDCMALGVGLFASVMATWKPNDEFTYGYGRVETLSGFANGVFLILISVFIVFEAVQRIVDPPDMNTDQLLLVSSIGLAINLFGLFATGGHHHHGHSHGHDHGHSHAPAPKPKPVAVKVHSPPRKAVVVSSHSHSHDHDGHDHSAHSHDEHDHHAHSHTPDDKKKAHSHDDHDHSSHDHSEHDHSSHSHGDHDHSSSSDKKHDDHDHAGHSHSHDDHDHSGHGHDHSAEDCEEGHDHDDHDHAGHDHSGHDHAGHNMHGVFLHVLADVLGSVGVIISTVLINWTGWTGWDPIASLLIATLIVASVVPLVIDSGKVLCLDAGQDMEKDVRAALSELSQIKGLASYGAPRFWPKDGSCYVGSIHIHLLPNTSSSSSTSNDPGRPSEALQQGYAHAKTYSNVEEVVGKVKKLLKSKIRGLSELNVQVEPSREGGGGNAKGFCSCLT